MTFLSSLANDRSPLILDTSVLINLHASMQGERILSALPNNLFVPNIVFAELEHETSRANGEHQFIRKLIAVGKVELITMNDQEYEIYSKLVSMNHSLDDGEAATIAIAANRNFLPIIDERKGRMQAESYCKGKLPCWSLDILRHPDVLTNLGESDSKLALYLALHNGRMRIHEEHCEHVVGVIGIEHALQCSCLPNFKIRKQEWQAYLNSELKV